MCRHISFLGTVAAAALLYAAGAAQAGPGPTPPSEVPDTVQQYSNSDIDQIVKFGNYDEVRRSRATLDKTSGKSLKELLAQDKKSAAELVQALKLPCAVNDAILLARGGEDVGGKPIAVETYEISCSVGLGYLAQKRAAPGVSSAFTCFAAEAARQTDIAAGRQPAPGCSLPANRDTKTIAAAVLDRAGKTCPIRDTKWLGQSAKANTDYFELACRDSGGMIIASPLPGSTEPVGVRSCQESVGSGVPCKLPGSLDNIAAYKQTLAEHKIPCTIADWRAIGTEALKKRRVVEFLCPKEQPDGLVAYFPPQPSAAAFETANCVAAKQHGITCKLTPR
jgi:hypothetical protein